VSRRYDSPCSPRLDAYTRSWDELVRLAHDEDASVELIRAAAKRLSR
jgi:hypothetical protein